MNETDAIHWYLHRYGALLSRQIDRLYNALEELQRTSLLLLATHGNDAAPLIDQWLNREQFSVDADGFYQSAPLLASYRRGKAPPDAISFSWGGQLRHDAIARRHLYSHRHIGPQLRHIHQRLGKAGWIYYQDATNTALQYPYIDQVTAITADFDWSGYHTFASVCPENNPQRQVRWTPPTIDYAGEGLILSVSIPVWQEDHFVGLWSIDLPLRSLYQDFAADKPFPEQDQWIIDNRGLLLLHDRLRAEIDQSQGRIFLHPLEELGGDWPSLDLQSLFQQESGQLTMRDSQGCPWLAAYLRIPRADWMLFCSVPEASLEEAAAQRLRTAFQQVGDGHFGSQVESSTSDALITDLVEEFNRMSQRLAQTEQDRQKIEVQLRQAQKMEAIGRLAGGVAHDYNNMINVIMGYAELAMERVDPAGTLHHDLNQIFEAAKRSTDITRQLLAFARCQTVEPRVIDVNEKVKSLITMLKRLIGEEIELRWFPGEQVRQINIDPTQIDQVLINVCVNARDAIDGIGKIVIETTNTTFDQTYCDLHPGFLAGDYVQLAISDDGAGMDKETLKNIFEPFFSTKERGKGTGLGLATVYGIIKQNSGFVNVYSEPGKGTTFRLYLPCDDGTPAIRDNQGEEAHCPARGETVLVVEDEPAILALAERLLTQLGYTPLTAGSPLAALELARAHPGAIDLLITDVVMPEMNGRELAERLQAFMPAIKVLYMSGYTANVIAKRGVLDVDVLLLQKPFSKDSFAIKVHQALRHSNRVAASPPSSPENGPNPALPAPNEATGTMDFSTLLHARQSVRRYIDRPVEPEKIDQMVEAVRLAPSASNSQPWKLIIVTDPVLKEQVARATFSPLVSFNKFVPQAPALAVLVIEKPKIITQIGGRLKDRDFPLIDIGIAAEHFCLQAAELGLGTCMLGWFDEPAVQRVLQIPKNRRIGLLIALGYSAEEAPPRPKIRKARGDMCSLNRY